jgi:hypothetical protein
VPRTAAPGVPRQCVANSRLRTSHRGYRATCPTPRRPRAQTGRRLNALSRPPRTLRQPIRSRGSTEPRRLLFSPKVRDAAGVASSISLTDLPPNSGDVFLALGSFAHSVIVLWATGPRGRAPRCSSLSARSGQIGLLTLRRFKFWSMHSTKLGNPFKRTAPLLLQNDTSKLHVKY